MQLRPDDKVLDLATGTADVPWASRDLRRLRSGKFSKEGDMGHEKTGGFNNTQRGKEKVLKIQGI